MLFHRIVWMIGIQICAAEIWYLSNKGKDNRDCTKKEEPCKSLRHVLTKTNRDDIIRIMAAFKHEKFHICDYEEPAVIRTSLSISGVDFEPVLYCKLKKFSILINKVEKENIVVTFKDLAFQGNMNHDTDWKCDPTENGIMNIFNANVSINNCYFYNICSAILLNFNSLEVHSASITSTEFTNVSYALYSDELRRSNITVHAVKVLGNAGVKDRVSHAVSLSCFDRIFFKITDSAILNTHEGISLTINEGDPDVKIDSVLFSENEGQCIILTFSSTEKQGNASVTISDCQFVKNAGIFASAVHLVDKNKEGKKQRKKKVKIEKCTFYENVAETFFGTVYADGITLYVRDSFFASNVAGELHGSIQGFGGAIYVEERTKVFVNNVTFMNNTCSGFGGTIFSRGTFSCVGCSFTGPTDILIRPLLGDILYATAGLTLINTSWESTVMKEVPRSLIWHPGSPTVEKWNITVSGYFKALCPEGHNISYTGIVRERNQASQIMMTCKPCPINTYSLTSGALNVTKSNNVIRQSLASVSSCYHCKYGGVCNKGSIRPQANYYGFRTGDLNDEVHFVPCPVGYCCQGDTCKKYDSCHKHRTGRLCGMCKDDMTENLINSNCVAPNECNDYWFWVIILPSGVLYILSFMYLDKISAFIKQQLIWWDQKIHHRNDLEEYEFVDAGYTSTSSSPASTQILNSPEPGPSNGSANQIDEITRLDSISGDTKDIFKKPGQETRGPDLFTDLLTLSFYFYQMFLLIRMRESIVFDYIMSVLRSVYTSMFTISIDGNTPVLLCPIRGLTAISKLLFVKSFACYVLALLLTLHITVYVIQYLLLQDFRRKEALIIFSIRLKVATIQILLISYATLSTAAVTLVSCIPMNKKSVLLIEGNVVCYTWWQFLIFTFVIAWVMPFPIVMVYSLIHLKTQVISYHQFIVAWAFPLGYLIWKFIFARFCTNPSTKSSQTRLFEHESLGEEERLSINEILFRLECPFKGNAKHLEGSQLADATDQEHHSALEVREPAFWQGAMIGRRLILILVLSFVKTPVSKYYCALFLCLVYLIHQLYYRPYLIKLANIYEMLTSAVLIIFCSMNLFFAYSYVSDIPPEASDENLSNIFRLFEAIILVFLPTMAVLVLLCLVLTRAVILIGKLFKAVLEYWKR